MKKLLFGTFLVFGLVFGAAAENAGDKEVASTARVETLVNRVNEIKEMDFKSLEKSERKALKKELKGIEKELKAEGLGSPVTLSLGALIIIVLLLIIIL